MPRVDLALHKYNIYYLNEATKLPHCGLLCLKEKNLKKEQKKKNPKVKMMKVKSS